MVLTWSGDGPARPGILAVMRRLPDPYADIAAGRPAAIGLAGPALLGSRLLTKELAFPPDEREAFGLRGLLPDRVLTIEEQCALELEHLRVKGDALEQYIGLAALQDRNATLFYRLLTDHLEEFMPIVYTPTVGRACQEFSHIIRRTRGTWITPADRDRIPELLRQGPYEDVRLIVVTDNERILGLGDQGAGGMAIPTGKLAIYTAACGIHPVADAARSRSTSGPTTRPSSPIRSTSAIGRHACAAPSTTRSSRPSSTGVEAVWPGCVIQFEDFKQANALRLLDRYRDRVPAFNDDIQGTAAVVVAGVLDGAARDGTVARATPGSCWSAPAAAGRRASAGCCERRCARPGCPRRPSREADRARRHAGLVHAGRTDLDDTKRDLAVPAVDGPATPTLLEVIRDRRPTVLVGATGVAGTFTEAVIDAMVERVGPADRPIVLPLSNPTSAAEATPADVLAWSQGRALVATGSPFDAVTLDGVRHEIGQANNAFIFPGVGLGAIVAETRTITDRMFLLAARALAATVTDERIAAGALYPPVSSLRAVSREIAITVVREAVDAGLARAAIAPDAVAEAVDAATWWPAYVPYRKVRMVERRREKRGVTHARPGGRPRGDRRRRRRPDARTGRAARG